MRLLSLLADGAATARAFSTGLAAMLAGVALAPGAAGAAPVLTFAFQGVVGNVSADDGIFGLPGSVQVGDSFSGHFSYETGPTNPDQMPGDPEIGVYDLLSFTVDQAVVPITPLALGVLHEPGGATIPPSPPDPGQDLLRVLATAPGYSNVRLELLADFGDVFSDDALPTSLVLSDFAERTVSGIVSLGIPPEPSILDTGRLTSLQPVPEPETAALLAAGTLAALTAAARGMWSRRK